jgi:putative SOS response-associated peptidase YedK
MTAARSSPSLAYGGFGRASARVRLASTACSREVAWPIHAKATPVLLTTEQEFDAWPDAPVNEAIALQRSLPNELLRIVAKGEKSDTVMVGA